MKVIDHDDIVIKYLTKWKWDHIFSEEALQWMKLITYLPNEHVLTEGEPVNAIFLLLEGTAKIVPSSAEGQIALIDFIEPMDFVGDLEYFSGDFYNHSIVTASEALFLAIPTKRIEKLFKSNVDFYKLLCQSLASKMMRTSIQYSNALLYPLKNRIAKYLLNLAESSNTPNIPISFKQTAEYFGITPRHFRRILKELEDEQAIQRYKTSIDILDSDILNQYAYTK